VDAPRWRTGRLLVAAPNLIDPNFRRTVVLMLEHSDEGALGVVLNRPTALTVTDALPADVLAAFAGDEPVFAGGPVDPGSVIVLGDYLAEHAPDSGEIALGTVRVVEPDSDFGTLPDRVHDLRVFGGYAGWSAGQLEEELDEEAWIDCACEPHDVFSGDPARLWHDVLDRQGGSLRLVARMPEDPSMN
jgi:putative transcriptional regulator